MNLRLHVCVVGLFLGVGGGTERWGGMNDRRHHVGVALCEEGIPGHIKYYHLVHGYADINNNRVQEVVLVGRC